MKESKNIYEFLNEIDLNIDDYEKEELSDIEKENLKKTFKKSVKRKVSFKKIGAIAAALVLTIGVLSQTSFGKNVYATAQSKVSEISYSIGKALGIEKNIEPYANVVNQVVEDNGIEVKLTDVIIDKDELIFSTIVNTNKAVDGCSLDYDIFINGKKLKNYGGSGSSGAIDDSNTLFCKTYCVDVKGIDTKENVDIKIVLSDLDYYLYNFEGTAIEEEGKINGKWKFEFTANGSELTANTYVLPLDYYFNIDNQQYTLKEFRYNPVNQKIYGRIEGNKSSDYDIKLEGQDDLGNSVCFGMSRMSGNKFILRYENVYGNLSDEATSITLVPYAVKFPEESGRMSNDWKQTGEKFTIFLNKEK
ncbi:MAG: DUF4179 domain-containing protein [Tissierellia bacterium]|nr:DUF4179 domain-containing protein [Tissierellia bacterium]